MNYDPEACLSVPGRLVLGPTQLLPATAPTQSPTVVNGGAGTLTAGVHQFAVSLTYPGGVESFLSPVSSFTASGSQRGSASCALHIANYPGATAVNLYMTHAGGSTFYFVFSDPDGFSSLTVNGPDSIYNTAYGGGKGAVSGFPFGGTPVGYVSGCTVVKETEHAYALSEALGIDRAQTFRGASRAALVFTLMQYDPTVYDETWASTTTSAGGYSGATVLSLPQPGRSVQPGLVTAASELLFVPDNPAHPAVLIYSPSICDETRQKLALVLHKPLESVFVAVCGLDASLRDLQIGRLADLTL